jgi:hypothetical protein
MSKAYDWKMLIQKRLIEDQIGTIPVIIVLFPDDQGFAAFERPTRASDFSVRGDTLFHGNEAYNLEGHPFSPSYHPLKRLKARQEFWHSWITFHPQTEVYRY